MRSVVTSHCVWWSRCCSWQWNRWVPAVPMTSHRSGKCVSTQLSLELSVPSPPQWPYSSPPHGRISPDFVCSLSLWTHQKKVVLSLFLKVHMKVKSHITPWNQFKHSFAWGLGRSQISSSWAGIWWLWGLSWEDFNWRYELTAQKVGHILGWSEGSVSSRLR